MYANSFLTQSYKHGYVHTWITSTGKEKAQAQLGSTVKEFPTVTGCKRWISQQTINPDPTNSDSTHAREVSALT